MIYCRAQSDADYNIINHKTNLMDCYSTEEAVEIFMWCLTYHLVKCPKKQSTEGHHEFCRCKLCGNVYVIGDPQLEGLGIYENDDLEETDNHDANQNVHLPEFLNENPIVKAIESYYPDKNIILSEVMKKLKEYVWYGPEQLYHIHTLCWSNVKIRNYNGVAYKISNAVCSKIAKSKWRFKKLINEYPNLVFSALYPIECIAHDSIELPDDELEDECINDEEI